jgi:hypothetical protein
VKYEHLTALLSPDYMATILFECHQFINSKLLTDEQTLELINVLPGRDSNPNFHGQNVACYLYTTGQCLNGIVSKMHYFQ